MFQYYSTKPEIIMNNIEKKLYILNDYSKKINKRQKYDDTKPFKYVLV